MNHTQIYTLTGMTCASCEHKVKNKLSEIPGVNKILADKETNTVTIEATKSIDFTTVQKKIEELGTKYSLATSHNDGEARDDPAHWTTTYRPILLIFTYLLVATLLIEYHQGSFSVHRWMRHFMAGFFLIFSFFKMLDLQGFKTSYQTYDVIAARWPAWGYAYAFIELILGCILILNFQPLLTYSFTFVLMSISIIGVIRSVLDKKKIQCACLGTVFDLPMSTVTIIEDGAMILMSMLMIASLM